MFHATITGWAATLAAIGCLIAFDLWQAHRRPHAVGLREAAGWSLCSIEDNVVVAAARRRGLSPMLLALLAIATTDIVFALDSIPAVFGITGHAYIVFAANAFALLGLRALYFLVSGLLDRLVYLSSGLAVVLGLIGVKLVLEFLHLHDPRVPEISTGLSLAVIAIVLAITTIASLARVRREPRRRAHAGALRARPEHVE